MPRIGLGKLYLYAHLLLVVVLFSVSLASLSPARVEMVVEMDFSSGFDAGYATCVYGDILYVVGTSDRHALVAGFSLFNRSMLYHWVSNWYGELYDCVVVGSNIYVVGAKGVGESSKWFVGVFSPRLELVSWRESYVRASALSIDYSNGYLYVSGFAKVGTIDGSDDVGWVIEKIDASNISNYITVTSNPSSGGDVASAIRVNPSDNTVWVVGLNAENRRWRIEVYDDNLRLLKARDLDIPNYPLAIDFDADGYAYIAGWGTVAKLDKDLNVVAKTSIGGNTAKLVVYNNTYLVVLSYHPDEQGFARHFVYLLDKHLVDVYSKCVTCNGTYSAYLDRGSSALVNGSLFVAGYAIANTTSLSGDTYVIVYRLTLPEKLPATVSVDEHRYDVRQAILLATPIAVVAGALILIVTRRRRVARGRADRKGKRAAKAYKVGKR